MNKLISKLAVATAAASLMAVSASAAVIIDEDFSSVTGSDLPFEPVLSSSDVDNGWFESASFASVFDDANNVWESGQWNTSSYVPSHGFGQINQDGSATTGIKTFEIVAKALQDDYSGTETLLVDIHFYGASALTGGTNEEFGLGVGAATGGDWTEIGIASTPATALTTSFTTLTTSAVDFTTGYEYVGFRVNFNNSGPLAARDHFAIDSISVIPEPSTYAAIFGAAVLGLAIIRRRKRA